MQYRKEINFWFFCKEIVKSLARVLKKKWKVALTFINLLM